MSSEQTTTRSGPPVGREIVRAIGEFPLTETADHRLQVHVRWVARERRGQTEIATTAVGIRMGDVVAEVDGARPQQIRLNRDWTAIPPSGLGTGGVTVARSDGATQLRAEQVTVSLATGDGLISRIDVRFPADYRGTLRGLLGDFDGDPVNDLRLRDGTLIRHNGNPAAVQRIIDGEFATSWRLRPGQSPLLS